MTFPNLVIGGAPKCGTSSLFSWLVDHPDVCGSKSKEPFFLMDVDHPLRRKYLNFHDHGLDAYGKAFPSNAAQCKVVVEASTHYIYQSTALDVLPSLPTKPRLVFLLRKPSDRVYSSFEYSKSKGNVFGDLTFPEFVRKITADSSTVPPDWAQRGSSYVLPRDIQYSRYIDYLSAWHSRLGSDRIRVLLFEDVRVRPRAIVQELCEWLGIDPSFYDDYDFVPRNRTLSLRSKGIQKAAMVLSSGIRSGPLKEALKRIYYSIQSKGRSASRTPADKAAIAQLDEDFRPYNERLAREFGLDLSAWE